MPLRYKPLKERRRRPGRALTLKPFMPSVALELEYRRRLVKLIAEMDCSVCYWITARYKQHTPHTAHDATPAVQLNYSVKELARQWQKRFNEAADVMADYFVTDIEQRNRRTLMRQLRDLGITVEMTITPGLRDVIKASVKANVALIRSIPSEYFTQIEGMVMRSVQAGRDLGTLTKDLQKQFGVTKRRAALISRDQNNKATAAIERARRLDVGINKALWRHSGAGKTYRRTHVANDGKPFDVSKGWYDPEVKRYIQPGELINCRCYSVAVVPGIGA